MEKIRSSKMVVFSNRFMSEIWLLYKARKAWISILMKLRRLGTASLAQIKRSHRLKSLSHFFFSDAQLEALDDQKPPGKS